MRGADFERYLTRLDEEISLGMFTPILLMRTADVGSYNLGVGHMQVYLWMLNAMNDDRAMYINKYILSKFTNYNFSPNAPRPKIVFRKLGNTDTDLIKQILVALIQAGKTSVDLDELGKIAGLSLKEIRETTKPEADPANPKPEESASDTPATDVAREIVTRVKAQVDKAFKDHKFNKDLKINMGFKKRFYRTMQEMGASNPDILTDTFYGRMDHWLRDIVTLGEDEFSGSESFMVMFEKVLYFELGRVTE
jgi:hypothetical protein